MIAPCATVSQTMIDELCDTPEKHQFLHAGGGFAVDFAARAFGISAVVGAGSDRLAGFLERLAVALEQVGADGLFTSAVGFLVAGGWASTLFHAKQGDPEQNFDSFVAQAELRFYLTSPPRRENEPGLYPSVLTFGYVRDWNQSYIGNYYHRDRGYASLGYFFNGVILASLTAGVSRLSFPESFFPNGAVSSNAFVAGSSRDAFVKERSKRSTAKGMKSSPKHREAERGAMQQSAVPDATA